MTIMIRMNRIINVQTEKGKTKLKIRKQNGQMIIFLKGRIDTNNAPQVDEKIFAALEGESYNEENIMIEAEDLEYISSAGLRVLMKLRKTIGKPLTIFNVNRDVYEIFDTTGFTELFNIKKALRSVSIEGCEEIGKGGHGKVYRLDPETIIKVYHDNSPLSLIEKEREYAKNAFVNGVPSAIPYDVVKTEQGYGLVFEMVGAVNVSRYITEHPEKM